MRKYVKNDHHAEPDRGIYAAQRPEPTSEPVCELDIGDPVALAPGEARIRAFAVEACLRMLEQ